MDKKLRVAVVFGGKSGEHDVSLLSAASVLQSMDPERYEIIPMGITKQGNWKIGGPSLTLLEGKINNELIGQIESQLPVVIEGGNEVLPALHPDQIDVVFPVLHGTYGEDGTIQGMLEMANIPYVGAGVLASAVAMDKAISKKVFAHAGLAQAKYLSYLRIHLEKNETKVLEEIEETLGYPCFIKPANLGSSVGISKANDRFELIEALQLAFKYDRKVVIEEFVPAREIEVAVLGNDEPEASSPGEIISSNDFYDFNAKYVDGKSVMQIPALLPEETLGNIQEMAITAYKAIDGSGLARVDFFVRNDTGEVLINEVNTLPGFTAFSMYAKMWEESGVSYSELLDRLIQLALRRHQEKQNLLTTFEVKK